MPPFVPRKQHHSSSPAPTPPSVKRQANAKSASRRVKTILFDTVDAPNTGKASVEKNKAFLASLDVDGDDDDSELSEADGGDFEDVPPAKRRKTSPAPRDEEEEEEEEEDEMDWEDAIAEASTPHAGPAPKLDEDEIADVSVSLNDDGTYIEPTVSLATGKKGPSKRERQVRVYTHELHVQALMWHNTVRNSWINDDEVQQVLVEGLPDGVKREVTTWRESMGTLSREELAEKTKQAAAAKGKGKRGKRLAKHNRGERDWHLDAEHLEQGVPNLSHGDPLLRLLKVLTAYWRKRFSVSAPALRKQGYKPLRRLRDEIRAWGKNHNDPREYGERVESLRAFRKLAKQCEGSRDLGAQLFTALLRGLGLEARMVANLQPAGIGWSKVEEAAPKKLKDVKAVVTSKSEAEVEPTPNGRSPKKSAVKLQRKEPSRKYMLGNKTEPICLENSDSELSSPPPDVDEQVEDDDDLSIIDITPSTAKKPSKKYDRDMAFPNYWTEVLSPVSHTYIPVDPIVLSTIASNAELLATFEPRGKRADSAKQVMAYTIAHNADGSAKDVTVRYLKKHQLPGKTKGVRMPAEKIPVYNHHGKVKLYEEYNWFRTVMSGYERPAVKRTAADDLEEATDLKPFKPAAEKARAETESLQWYKQSAEFVLKDHLRREEAIMPGAAPFKSFKAGKGDKAKDHPVYLRSDIVVCKTVESWHKEGRAIGIGEQPRKYVPMRAVTLVRKREIEDAQRETGEKLKQGLYSVDQTDWIIPPPIENGVIPRNAFGNMDVYVPTMVPAGAVHIPLKGTAKLCRKLEIGYAEACTGFEFGKQRAVPVLTGVVVARENERMVREAWREMERERRRKEDVKRTVAALAMWRKMVMGLRILERMRVEYAGGKGEVVNPFVNRAERVKMPVVTADMLDLSEGVDDGAGGDDTGGGGFFPPGHDEEEVPQHARKAARGIEMVNDDLDDSVMAGGFLLDDEEDRSLKEDEIAGHTRPGKNYAPVTPVSLQSMHRQTDGATASSAEDDVEQEQDKESTVSGGIMQTMTSDSGARKLAGGEPNGAAQGRKGATKGAKGAANVRKAALLDNKATRARTLPRQGRRAKLIEGESEGDISTSELSDVDSEGLMADSSDAESSPESSPDVKNLPQRTPHLSSPRVVVTQPGRNQRAGAWDGRKRTPLKSQYFRDDDDGEQSDEEVVRPRKTTARTRSRA